MDSSSGGVPRGVSNLAIQLNNQGLKSQIFSSGNTRKQIANNESLIKNLVRNLLLSNFIFSIFLK